MTDEEVEDFVAVNLSEYFKSTREKLYFEKNEENNLGKFAKPLYIFLSTSDKVEKYVPSNSSSNCLHFYVETLNIFYAELQLIYTKSMIKNKFKELLSELKKLKNTVWKISDSINLRLYQKKCL